MARGRAAPAPRSAAAAAPRARPTASSPPPPVARAAAAPAPAAAAPHAPQQAHSAPAPMHAAPAPPPAMPSAGGGGMFSGLMGSVVTGMAMGTGSAVASRAIDGMMGPREVVHKHEDSPVAAAASAPMTMMPQQQMQGNEGHCGVQQRAFSECMSKNQDMAACQYYFDAMQQCKSYA